MSDKINVSLSPDRLQVAPAATANTTITIKNASDVVEAYSIVVEGIDPQWCTLSVSSISLFPGDEERVQLTIKPPKASSSKAGVCNGTIKVTSNRDSTIQATVQIPVEIGRFLLFDLDLSPKMVSGRKGSYKLSITNNGNVPTTYTFAGKDPEDVCRFNFDQSSITVEPGAIVEVPVVVDPKKKPFTGKAKTHNFQITVTSHASDVGETKTVEAQFTCRPLVPTWAIAVGSVVVVAAVALIVLFLVVLAGKPPVIGSVTANPPTVGVNEASVITCVASDRDGDPLTYAWSPEAGTISGSGGSVTWTAPSAAGEYTISITVDDGTGRTDSGSVVVTAVITTGSIDVRSDPGGARVYLDGDDTGDITPYVIPDVQQGSHTIRLTREFHKDREEAVTVTAGETTYINWDMDSAPPQVVTIQPGPADGKDTWAGQHAADTASQVTPPFNLTLVAAGNAVTSNCRIYIQFDVGSIPATAVVTSASLSLFHALSDPSSASGPVGAYSVTSTWDATTLTWNNKPSSSDTTENTITVPFPAANSFITWDITNLVQSWVDQSIPNHGVMLRDTNETTPEGWKWFCSSEWGNPAQRPMLSITYYDPAP